MPSPRAKRAAVHSVRHHFSVLTELGDPTQPARAGKPGALLTCGEPLLVRSIMFIRHPSAQFVTTVVNTGRLHAIEPRDPSAHTAISPTDEIIAELKAGRMAILVDEEDRENEGDLIVAADRVTPEIINFMAKHGRGLICMPITVARAQQLDLAPMTPVNRSLHGTNFTVSIEAAEGVTTGISAADRAHTIRVACAPNARPQDIVHPGHVFPLVAQEGGVLARAGHTEACCDLARLAGFSPAAVLCEIMKDDGTMARLPDLIEFAQRHGLKIGAIADLIHYRSQNRAPDRARRRAADPHRGGRFSACRFPRQVEPTRRTWR